MLNLLVLFAPVLIWADAEKKKCLRDSLAEDLDDSLDECGMPDKIAKLQSDLAACNGGTGFTVLVHYNKMHYAYTGKDKTKGFDDMKTFAKKEFALQDDMDFFMSFKAPTTIVPSGDNFKFEIYDDKDLHEAIEFARQYNFKLILMMEVIYDFRDPQLKQFVGNTAQETDGGVVPGRSLKFTKTAGNTDLKLFYHDNGAVRGNSGAWCRWELEINGKPCESQAISGTLHTIAGEDDRVPIIVAGICKNVPATEENKFHTLTVKISRRDGQSNCITGWMMVGADRGVFKAGQNFVLEAEELVAGYQNIQYVTGAKVEEMDSGRITTSRQLTFNKVRDGTYMRVFWKDNIRVTGPATVYCRWEVHFDDANCKDPSHGIAMHIHTLSGDNDHFPKAVVGYCRMPKGEHKMNIYVNRVNGNANCFTGWGAPTADNYLMEVRELGDGHTDERVTWMQKYNQIDSRDAGYLNHRQLNFNKLKDDTTLRLLWSDNLRVHGAGRQCKWELYVDNKPCPSGQLSMSMYVGASDNDHQPGIVMGYCDDIPKGSHHLRVYVMANSGHNNHDCYTGWYWGTPNNWVLEVEEAYPIVIE